MADEDITKGKKKRKRRSSARLYENLNKPVRPRSVAVDELARDDQMCAAPDETKGTGNPAPAPHGSRPATDRLSPSRVTGGAAPSSGDHNAAAWSDPMNQPGPRRLAFGHEDMRNGTTSPVPLLSMRSNADSFPADLRGMSSGVPVALARLDAAAAAGVPGFRAAPSGNPAVRPADHSARLNVTGPNGGHGLAGVVSRAAPMATKGSDALRIMRQNQRRV